MRTPDDVRKVTELVASKVSDALVRRVEREAIKASRMHFHGSRGYPCYRGGSKRAGSKAIKPEKGGPVTMIDFRTSR